MDLFALASRLNEVEYVQTGILPEGISDPYNSSKFLLSYGSLMPGGSNHHEVSGIKGEWSKGFVNGWITDLHFEDGSTYPGLRWDPEGDIIKVAILNSSELSNQWERIDDFEGPEYRRVVVPYTLQNKERGLGQIYVIRQ